MLSLGRALGARWIVTGGYQRLGERLRITARLVDVTTGAVRRAVRADGATGELFALQDRIAAGLLSDGAPAGDRACRDGGAGRGGGRPPSGTGTAPARRRNPGRRTACDGAAGRGSSSLRAARNARGGRPGEPDGGGAGPRARAFAAPPTEPPSGAAAARPPTGGVGGFGVASAAGILTGRPSVRPTRTDTPPRIDGRLDDVVWRNATVITDFVQQTPLDGAPATEQTEVYLAYDTQNIYLGVYAHYSNPADIRANRSDRDQTFADDTLTVYFDPVPRPAARLRLLRERLRRAG